MSQMAYEHQPWHSFTHSGSSGTYSGTFLPRPQAQAKRQ